MNRRFFSVLVVATAAASCIGWSGVDSAFAQTGAAAAAPAQKPAPQGLSAGELADRVQAFYDKSKTFKAKFQQRYFVEAYRKTKDSSGSVVFEKPGKMSWRYEDNGNRVVSDGKLIKVYEKENKQMYEQPLEKSQYPAALSFLTGQGKLKESFKFTKQDSAQMKYASGYVLLGEPLQPTAAYDKVYFYVDGRTFQVRRVIIQDVQLNRNRFDFESPMVNTKPPQGEFAFTPPPGTQVIRP